MKHLTLKKHEERRISGGHLWIYSNEVDSHATPLKQFTPGEQGRVFSHNGKLLGTAMVNPHSLICARLVSRDQTVLDQNLLHARLETAMRLREKMFSTPHYRMVYGESDLLPGLVIDRYGDHFSVQLNCAGTDRMQDAILACLQDICHPQSILLRNDSPVRQLEGLERSIEVVHGQVPELVELEENTVPFLAPLASGQKTGWFYDQRPNRAWLRSFVRDMRVLDVFSYVGSFGIQAGVFGAKTVHCVDSSRTALEVAELNSRRNSIEAAFTGLVGDGFEVLQGLYDEGERYDLVIVDPPAFIKRKRDHQQGLRGYRRINHLGLRLVKPGGFYLSGSCSMHLGEEELVKILAECGGRQNRLLQIIARGGQGPDHPIHPAIPETGYLKALLCRAG